MGWREKMDPSGNFPVLAPHEQNPQNEQNLKNHPPSGGFAGFATFAQRGGKLKVGSRSNPEPDIPHDNDGGSLSMMDSEILGDNVKIVVTPDGSDVQVGGVEYKEQELIDLLGRGLERGHILDVHLIKGVFAGRVLNQAEVAGMEMKKISAKDCREQEPNNENQGSRKKTNPHIENLHLFN
jgi:hypothetical protein